MLLSILHRATGVALSAGMLMIVWWLVAAANGAGTYDTFISFVQSWIGQLLLFGWLLSLYFHLCSGIRHLIMDTGRLLAIKETDRAGIIIFIATAVLTLSTWAYLKHWI
jgi:succinate dehydrogenase / fumarate reductase cytochrome b subunit